MSDYHNQKEDILLSQPPEKTNTYAVNKQQLIDIATACQQRNFSEEVDLIEKIGGDLFLEKALHTNFKTGLRGDDSTQRIEFFGHNRKPDIEPKTFLELLINALEDFTLRILIVAAIASMAIEVGTSDASHRSTAWVEGFAILIAVFVCAGVTSINDYQKERQFQKLNKVADDRKRLTIARNGKITDVHNSEILVGDIIQIFEGMEIPADCLVIEANELSCDESAMTGETNTIAKNSYTVSLEKRNQLRAEGDHGKHSCPSPILMSGTKVVNGEGKMMVIVVGDDSCLGKISTLLRSDQDEPTPLQSKLEAIARDIGNFGLYSSIIIIIALLIRFSIEKSQVTWDNSYIGEILKYFILGITVVVVAIPEGLPLAVTLSLAYSTKKMLLDNNLVRKMAACETMGGANMICSDKTGTLTQNKMSLVSFWNEKTVSIDSYSQKIKLDSYFSSELKQLFLQSAIVNSTAILRPEQKGSKTEIACLEFIERADILYEDVRLQYPASLRFPFSSGRKRMSMVLELPDGKRRMVLKGASEIVFASCTHLYQQSTDSIVPITPELKNQVENAIEEMADKALRTLCIAYKDLAVKSGPEFENKDSKGVYEVETSGFVLVGILGIKDILRQEVPFAVKQCIRAGIKVRMVTGDNKSTARAIARECGIHNPNDPNALVMEGPEFIKIIGGVICKACKTITCDCPRDNQTAQKLGKEVRVDTIKYPEQFDRIINKLDVLSRSRPEDKYALVTGLIERGHVVAVTGDGTNDAPALNKADVGFAMGIAGTEVAREAADIILLDDNFSSIIKSVMWGRNIYDSIKKFLQFQLTVNVVAVFLTIFGAALIKQEILQPIQMLWINLIMDTFASLALATEPPTEELLNRKPYDRKEYIMTKKMFKHVLGQAIFQFTALMVLAFSAEMYIPESKDQLDSSDYANYLNYKYSDAYLNADGTYSCDYINYCTKVASGRLLTISGAQDYQFFFSKKKIFSRHFTFIYNAFVWMQIFNFLNCRKLQDEINIFSGLSNNYLFSVIVFIIMIGQGIIMTFTGYAFGLYPYFGLNGQQWGLSILIGSGSIPWNFMLKFLKEEVCFQFGMKEAQPGTESKILQLKNMNHEERVQRSMSTNYQGQQRKKSIKLEQGQVAPSEIR